MPRPRTKAKPDRQLSLTEPVCVECGHVGRLVAGVEVYGAASLYAKKMFYLCECGAYVGCHPKTALPLGRPAGLDTRKARGRAHDVFDILWRAKMETGVAQYRARGDAYAWLARQLGIRGNVCHISMFDRETCDRAIAICRPYADKLAGRLPRKDRVTKTAKGATVRR